MATGRDLTGVPLLVRRGQVDHVLVALDAALRIEHGRAERGLLHAKLPVTGLEQDLLGLLTAARGGLSGEDLHELTGAGLADIEEVLHTVAGRPFTADHAVVVD